MQAIWNERIRVLAHEMECIVDMHKDFQNNYDRFRKSYCKFYEQYEALLGLREEYSSFLGSKEMTLFYVKLASMSAKYVQEHEAFLKMHVKIMESQYEEHVFLEELGDWHNKVMFLKR